MLNKQIPIKQDKGDGSTLMVNSIFYTIQGEGPFAGSPAVFIRLQGCNLQCPDCDTEYTTGQAMHIGAIMSEVIKLTEIRVRNPLIVITGGEPFRQNIKRLVDMLLCEDRQVQIETNGTLFVDLEWAFAHHRFTIVCSPKAGKVHPKLWPHIKALKYVVDADMVNPEDGLPTLALNHSAAPQVARPPSIWRGDIYIQPVDVQDENENKRHLRAAMDSAMKFGYRLCIQIHKIIGVA